VLAITTSFLWWIAPPHSWLFEHCLGDQTLPFVCFYPILQMQQSTDISPTGPALDIIKSRKTLLHMDLVDPTPPTREWKNAIWTRETKNNPFVRIEFNTNLN